MSKKNCYNISISLFDLQSVKYYKSVASDMSDALQYSLYGVDANWDYPQAVNTNKQFPRTLKEKVDEEFANELKSITENINKIFGIPEKGFLGWDMAQDSHMITVTIPEPKCECGAHSVGSNRHSDWCDMSELNCKN